jgi:hypothetical protein
MVFHIDGQSGKTVFSKFLSQRKEIFFTSPVIVEEEERGIRG